MQVWGWDLVAPASFVDSTLELVLTVLWTPQQVVPLLKWNPPHQEGFCAEAPGGTERELKHGTVVIVKMGSPGWVRRQGHSCLHPTGVFLLR